MKVITERKGGFTVVYGYVRVSTREQHEERQLIAMKDFGVDRIYLDKQSGKDFQRPQYQKMVKKIKPEDVLVVKSIDRPGRNYQEILEQWRYITKEKNAAIIVVLRQFCQIANQCFALQGQVVGNLFVPHISCYTAVTKITVIFTIGIQLENILGNDVLFHDDYLQNAVKWIHDSVVGIYALIIR